MRSHLFYRWHRENYVVTVPPITSHIIGSDLLSKITPQKTRCHRSKDDTHLSALSSVYRWQRAFQVVIVTDDNPKTTLWSFHNVDNVSIKFWPVKRWHLKNHELIFHKRCNKNTLWSFLRTTTDILRCHPSPFLLHYLRCHLYYRWHRYICVFIPKKMTPLKIRCSR